MMHKYVIKSPKNGAESASPSDAVAGYYSGHGMFAPINDPGPSERLHLHKLRSNSNPANRRLR